MKYGYARVSTHEQDLDLQLMALKEFGCDEIFADKISGASYERPDLDRLRSKLRKGDHVVVWKLDRLFRSTQHALNQLDEWSGQGIVFTCTTQQALSTADTSASAQLMRKIFMAFADFEKDLISERTKAGMAAAKAKGKHIGRRKVLGTAQIEDAKAKIALGWS